MTPRTRSIVQITVLFVILILSIILLFANFAYLNTQANHDKQYIGHAGELRVLSQRIAKNATEAAAGKALAFKLLSDARNDFERRWSYLREGDKSTGLPAAPPAVRDEMEAVRQDWENLSARTPTPFWPANRPCCRCTRWRRPSPKPYRNCRSNMKRWSRSCCKVVLRPIR